MSSAGRIIYFMGEAVENYRQNKIISFLSTATITISMLILGFFLLLYFNIGHAIEGWGDGIKIVVYLKEGVTPEETEGVKDFIAKRAEVESHTYISKEKALEDFKKRLGDRSILDSLSSNPLPVSFVLKLKEEHKSSNSAESIALALGALNGVEEVDYGKEWVRRFELAMGIMKTIVLAFGGLLGVAVIFIVSNTIKLKVYSRAGEIEIMKLVGATDGFIKGPFLVEGLFQGFISASIAIAVLYAVNRFFIIKAAHMSESFFALSRIPFIPAGYLLGLVLFGSFLGYLGSLVSVGRFLKA